MRYLVLVLAFFAFPAVCAAEAVSVTPMEWDFGDVVVGESVSKVFGIESIDPLTPVELGQIDIENDLFSAFTITLLDPIPAELYIEDGPIHFEVTFTPLSLGYFDAVVSIESNDTHNFPPAGTVLVPLMGNGVSTAVPEPGSLVVWLLLGAAGLVYAWSRRRA
ncbi:MAG: PEP-CTERM sorting domain-containing protein [Pirellulales bacterium]|nr:PEP-CTERM sorting domain-containing protein [Pirellulales bacterium]